MHEVIYVLFFLLSFFHSAVGLGGGTSYNALLILIGVDYSMVASVSLLFNLVVSALASINYIFARYFSFKTLLPFLLTSIPFSYLGGTIIVPKSIFVVLLMIYLISSIVYLQFFLSKKGKIFLSKKIIFISSLITGGVLGFISGIVGIGGGIFLIPILIIFRLASVKEAAACGAVFIFINSLFGLLSRIQHDSFLLIDLEYILFIVLCIFGGAFLGAFFGARKFNFRILKNILTSILTLISIILFLQSIIGGRY